MPNVDILWKKVFRWQRSSHFTVMGGPRCYASGELWRVGELSSFLQVTGSSMGSLGTKSAQVAGFPSSPIRSIANTYVVHFCL